MTGNETNEFDWSQGDPQYARILAEEAAVLEMSETIALAMEFRGINRAELARRCGVTPSAITQRLRGTANTTVRKLAAVLDVLDYDLRFELVDRDTGQCHQVHNHAREVEYDGLLRPAFASWSGSVRETSRNGKTYGWT